MKTFPRFFQNVKGIFFHDTAHIRDKRHGKILNKNENLSTFQKTVNALTLQVTSINQTTFLGPGSCCIPVL